MDSSILALDIGNTNIHIGLWHEANWNLNWRIRTVSQKMPDEYAVLLGNFFRDGGFEWAAIKHVVIGSVVPSLTTTFVELSQRYAQVNPLIVSGRSNVGIKVDVDQPESVGADRIANTVAAHKLFGGPAIVVDFGTATNFDVVSPEGNYIGGSIAPGIGISLEALVGRTSQLYKVALEPPRHPIGRNTAECIQSGIFWGYVGLVEGLIARLRNSMPMLEHAKIIATGGLAPLFRQHTPVIESIAPYLTLDGLRLIYELNRITAD